MAPASTRLCPHTQQCGGRRESATTVRRGRAVARETQEKGNNRTSSFQGEKTAAVPARGPPPTRRHTRGPDPGLPSSAARQTQARAGRLPEDCPTYPAHEPHGVHGTLLLPRTASDDGADGTAACPPQVRRRPLCSDAPAKRPPDPAVMATAPEGPGGHRRSEGGTAGRKGALWGHQDG